MFKGKTLLITGGTGSFGNAVLKALLSSDLKEIRIFSRDEKKQDDMRRIYKNDSLKFYIGDVRDPNSIDDAMTGVDFVFHAAALKQVPSCEFFPMEAVRTNIIGTDNVLNSAIRNKVSRVICLSTDKAAYPINAMGISKAMMEKVFVSKAIKAESSLTTIVGTRYGNVMASRGSVIPLFIDQILSGSDITITNPEMSRFIMSLEDAVKLVIFAFSNGKPGDIFVQKAPSTTIGNLAEALLFIFNAKNKIRIIGPRHGEKLFETLLTKEEKFKAIDLGDFFRIPSDQRSLNYDKYFVEGDLEINNSIEFNSHNCYRLTQSELVKKLLDLEYVKLSLKR